MEKRTPQFRQFFLFGSYPKNAHLLVEISLFIFFLVYPKNLVP